MADVYDELVAAGPDCPDCGRTMVRKTECYGNLEVILHVLHPFVCPGCGREVESS